MHTNAYVKKNFFNSQKPGPLGQKYLALPWSFVSKITNSKHQKTNKLQTTSSKLQAPNYK
jgi:hypothetical protein